MVRWRSRHSWELAEGILLRLIFFTSAVKMNGPSVCRRARPLAGFTLVEAPVALSMAAAAAAGRQPQPVTGDDEAPGLPVPLNSVHGPDPEPRR